jgi:hypothetical protein
MFLARLDDDLRSANLFNLAREQGTQLFAFLRGYAPGAAVGHDPLVVQRAKVGACRHIAAL